MGRCIGLGVQREEQSQLDRAAIQPHLALTFIALLVKLPSSRPSQHLSCLCIRPDRRCDLVQGGDDGAGKSRFG